MGRAREILDAGLQTAGRAVERGRGKPETGLACGCGLCRTIGHFRASLGEQLFHP